MKKFFGVVFSVGLVAVLWFTLKEKANVTKLEKSGAQAAMPTEPKKVDLSKGKLSDVLKNKKIPIKATQKRSEPKTEIQALCQQVRRLLAEMTLEEFRAEVLSGEAWLDIKCLEFEPKEIQGWARKFYVACTKEEIQKSPNLCSDLGVFMKAQILSEQVEDKSLENLTDEELIAVFISNMLQQKATPFLEEMAQRFPNSPNVAKAVLAASLVEAKSSEELMKSIDKYLGKAIQLNPDDIELLATDMHMAVMRNEPNIVANIHEFNRSNPKSGIGYYELAFHQWKNGNRQQSEAFLETAIKIEPHNGNFKNVREKIKTRKVGEKAFQLQLRFFPEDF